MKKILFLLMLPSAVHAAQMYSVWGELPPSINKQAFDNQLLKINEKNDHIRYQLMYKGLPVWGYHIIEHKIGSVHFSGQLFKGMEKDIPSIESKLAAEDILKQYLPENSKLVSIKKVIYVEGRLAKLAYHLTYFNKKNQMMTHPNTIIDANDGSVLKTFEGLHTQRIGQGIGGNYISLATRASDFQYGDGNLADKALGRFDVTVSQGQCIVANKNFEVVNLQNRAFDWDLFPVSDLEQNKYKTFRYPCNRQSHYVNLDDGGYAPVHEGLSPVNDTMFFAQTTLDMYQQVYGDDKPFGDDLPIRAYTHIANLDNAFAIGSVYDNGKIMSHQQIVIGNGDYMFAPMSQTTIPHELTHNVTSNYSGLIYEGQSGGLDEAFSDMADLALRDYLSRLYPWYWNGKDWSIGREEVLSGEPLRYMEKPSDDGYSIDTASDYYEGLDVHFSSGVFNRAFYLLAHQPGWTAQMAFQVMFDANRYYWIPNTNFNFAACGVIQATIDRAWDTKMVVNAFEQVAVKCPLLNQRDQQPKA